MYECSQIVSLRTLVIWLVSAPTLRAAVWQQTSWRPDAALSPVRHGPGPESAIQCALLLGVTPTENVFCHRPSSDVECSVYAVTHCFKPLEGPPGDEDCWTTHDMEEKCCPEVDGIT